jgi:hypothetical protein
MMPNKAWESDGLGVLRFIFIFRVRHRICLSYFLVLAFAVGVGLVAWLLLWVRSWWNRRKQPASDQISGEIIDAEYTVVSRQDED